MNILLLLGHPFFFSFFFVVFFISRQMELLAAEMDGEGRKERWTKMDSHFYESKQFLGMIEEG
jgi:hypothetical protein